MYSFVNRFPPNLFFDILLFTFYAFRNRQSFSTANARWLILFFVSFPGKSLVVSFGHKDRIIPETGVTAFLFDNLTFYYAFE